MWVLIMALCFHIATSDNVWMTTDDVPNPGPESPDTVYVPGTPGADWTPEEVETTRQRVIQMIHPVWRVKVEMGKPNSNCYR